MDTGTLRTGFTTGACATATSLAAARHLLLGESLSSIVIGLPRGEQVRFALGFCRPWADGAEAGTIKDAGDDPDVTHGALVFARVRRLAAPGVVFKAGPGVGTVTRPGLSLAVGEPAINPVPRQMMTDHLRALAAEVGYDGGFEVAIGVGDGERLAEKTMNARLGIVGGLSILGTTGIVRPYSCSAYIASIHRGIDVAVMDGQTHLGASTGNRSEHALRRQTGLPDIALIEMGDFAGAVLKYLRTQPQVTRLSLCGGFGKISKLAAGHLNLHSGQSGVDLAALAATAEALGADAHTCAAIVAANTTIEALDIAARAGLPLADAVCTRAAAVAREAVRRPIDLQIQAIDRQGLIVGASS